MILMDGTYYMDSEVAYYCAGYRTMGSNPTRTTLCDPHFFLSLAFFVSVSKV